MATSGTTTFESGFAIDDIIQEAYDRVGLRSVSGYQLKSARRSLNIMFQEWANRGLHYWEIDKTNVDLVEGQAEYKFFRSSDDGTSATTAPTNGIYGVDDVLEAALRDNRATTNQSDSALTKINRSQYQALSNKTSTGQPSQYYVDRQTTPTITLYLTPDASTYTHLHYYTLKRIEDAGAYTNNPDIPFRFLPCMISGLAFYLSLKYLR